MSRINEAEDSEQRHERQQAEREAQDWSSDTGYRPNVNQRRHEPMRASHHDEREATPASSRSDAAARARDSGNREEPRDSEE